METRIARLPAWIACVGSSGNDRSRPSLQVKGAHPSCVAEVGACTAVFDGLLENRKELGDLLGSSFPEGTDAELVARLFLRYGEEYLKRLKGLFSLVVWDNTTERGIAAHDPLGAYPLYYRVLPRDVSFSMSIDTLAGQDPSARLNRAALADYLLHRWPKLHETFFEGICRIPPGHAMRLGASGISVFRYWDPSPPGQPMAWIVEQELEQFDHLLGHAVEQYVGDGPAGIYLSGGLDSVTVAAIAVDISRRKGLPAPRALSLQFPHPDCDESELQAKVARRLGMQQVMVNLSDAVGPDGVLMAALQLSRDWPWPLMNPWLPAYLRLGADAKAMGCNVVLTGGGGDEWLTVGSVLAADLVRQMDLRGLYRLWDSGRRSYNVSGLTVLRSLWQDGVSRALYDLYLRSALRPVVRALRRAAGVTPNRPELPDWAVPDHALRHELDARAEVGYRTYASDSLYVQEMRKAMDHPLVAMEIEEVFEESRRLSLPVRQPFWDAGLVDLLFRTPPLLLIRDGRSKGLVRASLARRFPDVGFERQRKPVALNYFCSLILRDAAAAWDKVGGVRALSEMGLVDSARIGAEIQRIIKEQDVHNAYRIWDVLNMEVWLRPRIGEYGNSF
jgi:asparagine synthase (glutamine-hydrolysing)